MLKTSFFSHIDDACIYVSGADSAIFLQGQLSCDIKKITDLQPVLGTRLDRKGRVIAVVLVWSFQDGYILQTTDTLAELLVQDLKHYVLRSKVVFSFLNTATLTLIGVLGELPETLKDAKNFSLPTKNATPLQMLCVPSNEINKVLEILSAIYPEEPRVNWHQALVAAGLPVLNLSTQGQFTPFELNLDIHQALDWKKGCYLGQEIVARIHYRGQVKKRSRLMHVKNYTELYPGQILTSLNDETPIATVVDVVNCSHLAIACVILPVDFKKHSISYEEATLIYLEQPFPMDTIIT